MAYEDVPDINPAIAEIMEEFQAWKDEILRILGNSNTNPEILTSKVGGLSYAEIVAIIDQELLNHVNQRNVHGLTLAALGGMTKGAYDTMEKSYYPKSGMPFTTVKGVPYSVAGNVLKISDLQFVHMGNVTTSMGGSFTVTTTARQYIKYRITRGASGFKEVATVMEADASEDINTIVVGHVALVGGVVTPVFTDVIRIGYAAISKTRRGLAIPATTGTPTQPQSLPANWFA